MFFLIEEENEQQLWEIWLNKETSHSEDFNKFKAETKRLQLKKQKKRAFNKEAEKAAEDKAAAILSGTF